MTVAAPVLSRGIAALAMTASAACWGFATILTKAVLAEIPPFTTLAIQLSASVAFLWAATLCAGQKVSLDRTAVRAAGAGALEPGLAYGVGVPGLALTSAASASVIGAAEPAVILLLSWLMFRERVAPVLMLAMPFATAGVLLVTLDGAAAAPRQAIGDAMILAGVVFAALYVLLSSRSVTTFHPLPLAALQQSVGLLCALGMLAVAQAAGAEVVAVPTPSALSLALASGVVQYALAFLLYLIGLRALPVGSAGLFLALIPLFGVAGAAAVLGETISVAQMIGAIMIVAAVLGATWRSAR